ncbi:MAG: ArsR/SmtB family transcription factor [Thermoplasmatota archaeon]
MNSGLFLSCVADPTRYALLTQLAEGNPSVTELVVATGQSQSNVSHHLKQLRQCGLVTYERDGKSNRYTLSTPALSKFLETVEATTKALESLCHCEVCE